MVGTSLVHVLIAVLTAVVCSAMMRRVQKNEDLEDQLVFYSSYHQDPVNIAIHCVFIPMIWWTILVIVAHYPLLGLNLELPIIKHKITWATSQFVVYGAYYIWMDKLNGSIAALVMTLMYAVACRLAKRNDGRVFRIAIILQILSWYMQIHPGHMVFEGVKPALVDSLGDALTVAPFFSLYDIKWALFPSSSPESLQARVLAGVVQRRLEMCRVNSALRFCTH
jgi:uncharacterized membrane protein YGL010W